MTATRATIRTDRRLALKAAWTAERGQEATVTFSTTTAVDRPSDPIDELFTISAGRLHIRCTGTSDRPPTTQTFETQAVDLHELLDEIGESGPFVVVGHSFGRAEAVTFASTRSDEADGLMLVDAREYKP